jgi:hypothetical protein
MTSEALKQIDRETGPATSQQSRDQVKSKEKLKISPVKNEDLRADPFEPLTEANKV